MSNSTEFDQFFIWTDSDLSQAWLGQVWVKLGPSEVRSRHNHVKLVKMNLGQVSKVDPK